MFPEKSSILLFKKVIEEKVGEWLEAYRIPLIFAFLGAVFVLGGVFMTMKDQKGQGVVFNEATQSAGLKIKVDIEGEVQKPGVYEVERGIRVGDLIQLAGGFTGEADKDWVSRNLNLAQALEDGSKVYVPEKGQNENLKGQSQNENLININNATEEELDTLPGIGPVTAQKIIDNRPYLSLEELKSKKVVSDSVFEKIKEKITI